MKASGQLAGRSSPVSVVADLGVGEAVGLVGPAEREAVLVGDPLLVDLGVVTGEAAHHLAAAVVDPDRRAAGVVLGDRRRRDEVEGPRAEAVRRGGQRADRADLDGVAGEVALERLLLVDPDLLERAALDERDEGVAGDLLGEAGAARAQHAALAVEQDLGGDVDRLGVEPLVLGEPGLAAAVAHRLVLQRALAALVADGAVERVVDQQELHLSLLGLVGDRRGGLGVDHHPLGDGDRARGLRLGHPTAVARVGDLDQALPAGADRRQQRVVAEPRDLHADPLGRPDHQGVLGHRDLDAVDGQGDLVGLLHLSGR